MDISTEIMLCLIILLTFLFQFQGAESITGYIYSDANVGDRVRINSSPPLTKRHDFLKVEVADRYAPRNYYRVRERNATNSYSDKVLNKLPIPHFYIFMFSSILTIETATSR
jgi:hypothetical protein